LFRLLLPQSGLCFLFYGICVILLK